MYTIHEGLRKIIRMLEGLTLDAQKFDEGNAKAGTRVTKVMMAAMKECKALRKAALDIRKARKERKT